MTAHSDIVMKARVLATSAHHGQKDKIGEDYIHHPAAVAELVMRLPGFEALNAEDRTTALAAAWLHDVLEDTPLGLEDLQREGFSDHIISTVSALTLNRGETREDYYQRIKGNHVARLVKIADVAHNSSEARLRWLDPQTQERLRAKYARASQVLVFSETEQTWLARNASATPGSSR